MTRTLPAFLLMASSSLLACGGLTQGDDNNTVDGAADVPTHDAGFTACSGPGGQALCGGNCGATCSPQACASNIGLPPPDATPADAALGLCLGAGTYGVGCNQCEDGLLCVPETLEQAVSDPAKEFHNLAQADVGYAIMYAMNGDGNAVRYSDRSQYSGSPIPSAPTSCPSTSGFQLCGGGCGACATGFSCTGRSPLHPYSLCVDNFLGQANKPQPQDACVRGAANGGGCNGNPQIPPLACLTFKVSGADQPVADANGICVEASLCAAAAQSYPGGVYCTM